MGLRSTPLPFETHHQHRQDASIDLDSTSRSSCWITLIYTRSYYWFVDQMKQPGPSGHLSDTCCKRCEFTRYPLLPRAFTMWSIHLTGYSLTSWDGECLNVKAPAVRLPIFFLTGSKLSTDAKRLP